MLQGSVVILEDRIGGEIAVADEKLDALVTDRVSSFSDVNPGPAPLSRRATSARCCCLGVERRSGPVVVQEKEIPVPTYPKAYDGVTPGTLRH
jgi:hypothetical protein